VPSFSALAAAPGPRSPVHPEPSQPAPESSEPADAAAVAAPTNAAAVALPPLSTVLSSVDEAFTNIIEHAYRNDEKQSVKITLGQNGQTFWISLFDSGESFSLTDYKKPDVEKKIKQKKRGGVGVYLIKKLMDDVEYLHEGPQNEIRMIKKR
jgi:serine/threonine-protein kinase RsbW